MHDLNERELVAAEDVDLGVRLFLQKAVNTEVRVCRATRLVAAVLGTAFLVTSGAELLSLLAKLMQLTPVGLGEAVSTALAMVVQLLLGAMLLRTARHGRDVLQEREERRTWERRQLASD